MADNGIFSHSTFVMDRNCLDTENLTKDVGLVRMVHRANGCGGCLGVLGIFLVNKFGTSVNL